MFLVGASVSAFSPGHLLMNVMHTFFLARLRNFFRTPPWTFIAWFEDDSKSSIDLTQELTDVPLFRWDYCITSAGKHLIQDSDLFIQEDPQQSASCKVAFTKTGNFM